MARTVQNALGQAACAAKRKSNRLKAHVAVGHVAGLGSVDGASLRLLDLAREVTALRRELAACTRELLLAFRSGRKPSSLAATDCTVIPSRSIPSSSHSSWQHARRRRTTRESTAVRKDVLRGRLCWLLECKRSTRARGGRRPAVFRRPAFRTRHAALARELFKPAPAQCSEACSGSEYLASSGAEGPCGLTKRQTTMPGRAETVAMLRIVCVYNTDVSADVCATGCTSGLDGGVEVLAGNVFALQPMPSGLTHPPPSESPSLARRPASDPEKQNWAVQTHTRPEAVVQVVFRVAGCDASCVCARADQALSQALNAALVCGGGKRLSWAEEKTRSAALICLRAARDDATLAEAGVVSGWGCVVDVLVSRAAGMDSLGVWELDNLHAQIEEQMVSLASLMRHFESEVGMNADSNRFSELEDDAELFRDLFRELDVDNNGSISQGEIEEAMKGFSGHEEMKKVLQSLLESKSLSQVHEEHSAGKGVDFKEFSELLARLPRVGGERVKWARTLRMEELLAKHLPKGDIFDGLKGLREIPVSERRALAESLTAKVSAILPELILEKLNALAQSDVPPSAEALSFVNSKFCLDDAYVGRFASLKDFYRGPEALIGTPNPKIKEGMEIEHCRRDNREVKFTTSNYNVETWSSLEWEFVVDPKEGFEYPHTPSDKTKWKPEQIWSEANTAGWKGTHGRDPIKVDAYVVGEVAEIAEQLKALDTVLADKVKQARSEVKRAGLLMEEVIGLRLYTGPLFVLYNAVLRGFPEKDVKLLMGNKYETCIFAITSGITKLSKTTAVPADRLLYRGLGGMILPRQFWDIYDECIVEVRIRAVGMVESAESVVAAVKELLCKALGQDESAKGRVFDLSVEFLQLPYDCVPETLREAAPSGIRVVRDPQAAGEFVSMSLALPVTKFRFEEELREDFEQALGAACRRHVEIVSIADKPHGFRGGGAHDMRAASSLAQSGPVVAKSESPGPGAGATAVPATS